MPTIKYKPTTPARRHMSVPTFEEITKFTPEKSLLARICGDIWMETMRVSSRS